jgi:photosystem II stability/assembly factor-like uncharacterized protein
MRLAFLLQWLLYSIGVAWNSWQLEEPNMNVQALLEVSDETVLVGTDIGIYRIDRGKGRFVHLIENVIALGNSSRRPRLVYALSGGHRHSYLLRSEDAGLSWEQLPLEGWARCMLVDPDDPDVIYVGFLWEPTLLKSTDGGRSWRRCTNGIPQSSSDRHTTGIYQLAGSSRYLYAIFSADRNGLAVSRDGGGHWEIVGLPDEIKPEEVSLLVPDLNIPKIAYMRKGKRLYRTRDGGESWKYLYSFEGIIMDYQVHPLDPSRQYILRRIPPRFVYLCVSEDGGRRWQRGRRVLEGLYISVYDYDKVHVWPGMRSADSIYLTLRGYVARSDDRGTTWRLLYNRRLEIRPRAIGATADGLLLSGTDPISRESEVLFRYENEEEWRVIASPPFSFIRMLTGGRQPNLIYGLGTVNLYRSEDGGRSWVELPIGWRNLSLPHGYSSHKLVMVPGDPSHLLTVQRNGYAESRDRGSTWTFRPTPWQIYQLAVSSDLERLYALVGSGEEYLGQRQPDSWLFRSSDGGRSWEEIHFRERAYGIPEFIAVHPARPGYLYVNSTEGLFVSTNDGLSWRWIPEMGRLKIHRFLFHPILPDKLYILGEPRGWDGRGYIFTSDDAGRSWRDISAGVVSSRIGISEIWDMVIAPMSPYPLYLLTEQGSIWSYADVSAQIVREGVLERRFALPTYPNPVQTGTWIPYYLKEDGSVRLEIYDLKGRRVRTLHVGWQPAGIYLSPDRALYWDGRNERGERVASGVYFYILRAAQTSITRTLVLCR